MKDIIVIDDFLSDPYAVRNSALEKRFDFFGNYPGMRSSGVDIETSNMLKKEFEKILDTEIDVWNNYSGGVEKMNTCFQLCLENDKSWVHHDATEWAAVLYLSPDPNIDSGTGFFYHKPTDIIRWDRGDSRTDMNHNKDLLDQNNWYCHMEVKNVFNRLILYRGEMYHRSMIPGFGRNYIDGRLTQVFFFNTISFYK
jgi:hypothetical protein